MPGASPQHKDFFLPWAKRLQDQSGGRLVVDVADGSRLSGSPATLLSRVENGEIDVAWTLLGYTPDRFPKLEVFELPWITSSRAAVTSRAVYEFYDTVARDEFANVHVLAVWAHSGGAIMTRNQTLVRPADLAGLRLRTPSQVIGQTLAGMGAKAELLPAPQAVKHLREGQLDGTVFPYEVIPTFSLQRDVKQIAEFAGDRGFYTAVFVLLMNKRVFQNLPADSRRVVEANSGARLSFELGTLWDQFETLGRDAFLAGGGEINFIKSSDYDVWRAQTAGAAQAWKSKLAKLGLNGEDLIVKANELVSKYSRLARDFQ